ncbi:oxidoreductase, partial [Rhodovulum visakhapatnamense]|nr:oxidoreductase [Rhodovulum visakhapatnamense]
LRAAGQLIPEQYPMARACGFDEVEIDADRARRQPEADWRAAARRQGYLARLRRPAA